MSHFGLPHRFKVVEALAPQTSNGAKTCNNVCLKNVQRAWIVAHYTQAVAHATTIQPVVGATDVACTTAITFSARWWKNVDTATSDALVAQTAGTTAACTAAATNHLMIIEIDPSAVAAQNATYDWLGATQASSGQATNFVSIVYYLEMRYQQETPPSVI